MSFLLCLLTALHFSNATKLVSTKMYLRTRDRWLETTPDRLEVARFLKLQRTEDIKPFRSDSSLARAMDVEPRAFHAWINRRGSLGLDDSLRVAAYLEVEPWWLLGYDILHRDFWSRLANPSGLKRTPRGFAHPNFAELLLAARHFDPIGCAEDLKHVKVVDEHARRGDIDVTTILGR